MNTINTYSDKNINDIFEKTTVNMKEDTTMDTINSYQDKGYDVEKFEMETTNTYQDKGYDVKKFEMETTNTYQDEGYDIYEKPNIDTKEVLNNEQ